MWPFPQNQRDEVRDFEKCVWGADGGAWDKAADLRPPRGAIVGRDVQNDPQRDHAVAYCMTAGEFTRVGAEQSPPIMARDYKDPHVIIKEDNRRDADKEAVSSRLAEDKPICMATGQANAEIGEDLCPTLSCNHEAPIITEPYYIVRRLTPTECARLQGFPDDWCAGLGTSDPTDTEIAFWGGMCLETHRKAVKGAKKPKTEKQIRKWLAAPYSDSAEYRLWGMASRFRALTLSCPGSSGQRGLMKQNEVWQGPALPEEVWMAPARVHRKGVTPMKALVITFLLFVIVLFVLVAYSLCVMAKDEDDAEQAEWIRDQNKRGGNGGEK